ncbi:UDP-N-acetylglucosamine 1-carboxyvinyltransferase, partial [Streptococcus agalactiae str. Gottschalk 1005B]
AEKLEELFNTLNPNRKLRLEREKLAKEKRIVK